MLTVQAVLMCLESQDFVEVIYASMLRKLTPAQVDTGLYK
jgi:hypothetical protein